MHTSMASTANTFIADSKVRWNETWVNLKRRNEETLHASQWVMKVEAIGEKRTHREHSFTYLIDAPKMMRPPTVHCCLLAVLLLWRAQQNRTPTHSCIDGCVLWLLFICSTAFNCEAGLSVMAVDSENYHQKRACPSIKMSDNIHATSVEIEIMWSW